MPKTDDLTFVRITHPNMWQFIPPELFRQIKEVDDETIARLECFGPMLVTSPTTLFYVLVDPEKKMQGLLWATIDIIEANVYVNAAAVTPEYQDSGIIKRGTDFLLGLKYGPKMKRELAMTTARPAAFEKNGWVKSKRIRMEYHDGEDGSNTSKRDNTPGPGKPAE